MGEMSTMPCPRCGEFHQMSHAEAIGAAWQPIRQCSAHRLIRVDRRAWWCSCGVDCLNTEGSFDEHKAANRD